MVVKPLDSGTLDVASGSLEFSARRLTLFELVRDASSISLAPTLLQEYIQKRSEVRVTVIGGDVHAVEFEPRDLEETIDWSQLHSGLEYRVILLPEDLQTRIRKFVTWYGLEFSALDFARSTSGDLIFLENNPNGAWYWLELETGLPLSDRMAELLTRPRLAATC
ncbi:hypothetical protein GCM10023175_00350 [Pseudonocardia xishanensis]|uniref:ATP-grasp domain-containing protein n=2 Tax=Pseudonocardia xishanensis TaxID=630995 RepID=A0ABP8RCP0_9PSEU